MDSVPMARRGVELQIARKVVLRCTRKLVTLTSCPLPHSFSWMRTCRDEWPPIRYSNLLATECKSPRSLDPLLSCFPTLCPSENLLKSLVYGPTV